MNIHESREAGNDSKSTSKGWRELKEDKERRDETYCDKTSKTKDHRGRSNWAEGKEASERELQCSSKWQVDAGWIKRHLAFSISGRGWGGGGYQPFHPKDGGRGWEMKQHILVQWTHRDRIKLMSNNHKTWIREEKRREEREREEGCRERKGKERRRKGGDWPVIRACAHWFVPLGRDTLSKGGHIEPFISTIVAETCDAESGFLGGTQRVPWVSAWVSE